MKTTEKIGRLAKDLNSIHLLSVKAKISGNEGEHNDLICSLGAISSQISILISRLEQDKNKTCLCREHRTNMNSCPKHKNM